MIVFSFISAIIFICKWTCIVINYKLCNYLTFKIVDNIDLKNGIIYNQPSMHDWQIKTWKYIQKINVWAF